MEYEIFKEKGIKINFKEIDDIIKKFVKLFNIPPQNYLSIAFVSPDVIKKLNYQYRKIDKATDVLSFGDKSSKYIDNANGFSAKNKSLVFFNLNFIGEIIICYERAFAQAKDNCVGVNYEIKKLLTHGLVHLMGYDHKTLKERKEMHDKEMEIFGE